MLISYTYPRPPLASTISLDSQDASSHRVNSAHASSRIVTSYWFFANLRLVESPKISASRQDASSRLAGPALDSYAVRASLGR